MEFKYLCRQDVMVKNFCGYIFYAIPSLCRTKELSLKPHMLKFNLIGFQDNVRKDVKILAKLSLRFDIKI